MPDTLEAPPEPALAQKAAEQGHYESLYGGLDKIDSQLSAESREQLTTLTEGEEDPQEARARMVNVAYIKAKNPQIDEDALMQNWPAAKSAYAKQVLGIDKQVVTDKELYTGIAAKMQKTRDERTLLGEGLNQLFDAFRAGGSDWRQAFTTTLAEMKGKPGYDPARLDVYRQLAESQWSHWDQAGQHYPQVVQALTDYFKQEKVPVSPNEYQVDAQPLIDRGNLRSAALEALSSVPHDQQDALIGLAMRGKGDAAPDDIFPNKLVNRGVKGTADFAISAGRSLKDLLQMGNGLGGFMLADQLGRKTERKLDAAVAGGVDPYQGGNWFSEGVLGATEGTPRMLAMFHPAGIAANVMAFSEESRSHFEDAGIDPTKAMGLGYAAAVPLTALQLVTSKMLVGSKATQVGEAWMMRNIAGKTGADLAKGYAKNILAQGAENTAILGTVTLGQQLTEPAVQSLGHLLDGTLPGVKWTGKDGELARLAGAAPHTLATLVPLIALGTGMATLRTRGGALEARTVQDRPALEALGLKPEGVEQVMAAGSAEDAVATLQHNFKDREPNPAAVEAMNKAAPEMPPGKVSLAEDGGYTVKDETGAPVAQTASAEMAAKAVEDLHAENAAPAGELFDTGDHFNLASEEQRATTGPMTPHAETMEMFGTAETRSYGATAMDKAKLRAEAMAQQDSQGVSLLDWIKGKLPRPEDARLLQGELRGIYENLSKDVSVPRARRGKNAEDAPRSAYNATNTSAANAFFAKKGVQGDLDRLRQAAVEAGFDFETPADMLAAVEEAMRGKKIFGNAREEVQTLGIVAGGGHIGDILNKGAAAAKQLAREVSSLPEFEGFHEVLGEWNRGIQTGIMNTTKDVKRVIAAVPDGLTRRAIGRWIDSGGDRATLEANAQDSTRESAKKEYQAALKLTPEQIAVAQAIQAWFKQRFERAVQAGVMDEKNFRQNYMTQIIDRPFVQGGDNSKFGGQLNKNFKFSEERTFPNLAELEKAGFSAKTTDVAEIMARYDTALNKAITSRQLVKDLLEAKNAAGEPLAVPLKGSVREGEGSEPNFINNPRQTMVDQTQGKIDELMKQITDLHEQLQAGTGQSRFDIADHIRDLREEIKELRAEQSPEDAKLYKSIDHPALRKYWWMGKDKTTGKETFIEGDIGLHPDIKTHLENALGTSGLRRWFDSEGNLMSAVPKALVKSVDVSNGFLKRNLLGGLSLFHAVHEYKRALGNRVAANPFTKLEINPEDPAVQLQLRTGLMLATPHDITALYDHTAGLGGAGSLIDHVPVIGKISKGVSEYTFSKLIPKLKSETWNHVYARNLETFKDAIARGEATKDQVAYLTSNQMNARFGHQNLADLGRNPTFQHILQIGTLAPDFWESNARNYGQDVQGLIGAKNGREPAIALASTAAVLWLTSRVLNKALDDDWHFDQPFAVVHDGRVYTMRNEVEDLVRLWQNARAYVMGRLSPTAQAFEEWRSGTNWRGEKITTAEVFKNWIAKVFPMSLRFLPGIKDATDALETGGGRTVSVWQQFLGSIGIQVGRHSPLNDAYQLANDWRKAHGDKEDRGTYPTSKYQQLRYALEDKDDAKAIEEMAKLRKSGEPPYKLLRGFESSVLHSWTGSREKDSEFMESLKPEDRAKVEKANAHRQMLLERFRAILQSADSSTTNP